MKYENYDPCFPDQPVVDLYLSIWAKLPAFRSKPAFIWAEDGPKGSSRCSILTYEWLNNIVRVISSQLLLLLQKGDTVVVLCAPGLELVETIFACQRAGLLAVPIAPPDPSFAKDDFHHLIRVLSQTKPKAAVASGDYIEHVTRYISSPSRINKKLLDLLQKLRWISTEGLKGMGLKTDKAPCNPSEAYGGCKAHDAYLIQYTSGSTGIPKPVIVTAGSAAHNARAARKAYDLHPNSVIISWLPQYHDCGLMFLLLTIVSGATCVLTSPNAFINRPRIWLELITEFRATCTPVPSFTLPLVVKRGGLDKGTAPISLGSMKNLIIINEPIYRTSVEEFVEVYRPLGLNPSSIAPSYGLAENCTFVSTAWRNDDDNGFPTYKKLLPSARLTSSATEEDIEILVVNEESCEPVEDGNEGEIWISSPSNASGYLGHPYLTCEVFNGRLHGKVTTCFVRSGDRGIVIGKERFLFVTGRCMDLIKLPKGQDIHPHYIETTAYTSSPWLVRGGCLAAFELSRTIVVVAELQRSVEETGVLRRICEGIRQALLREENVEVGMVVLVKGGSVPKTTSGKVQRWAAKNKLVEGRMGIVMKMEFGDSGSNAALFLRMIQASERKEEKEARKVMIGEETSAPKHHPLHSSL